MAVLPIHKYFVYNGSIEPVQNFRVSENEGGIYEVIRVHNGAPLFLYEHLQRFINSANLAEKQLPFSVNEIEKLFLQLIRVNEVTVGNVLISFRTKLKLFFIPHRYPTESNYRDGVKCGVLKAERINPNAKVFQTTVRKEANALIERHGWYEVLLVDNDQRITEGSRSNVFFVKGDELLTPLPQKVLLGITRQKTIECAEKLCYKVLEKDIALEELSDFDGLFITGTSPKILPVSAVEHLAFDAANPIIRKLMQAFDEIITKEKE